MLGEIGLGDMHAVFDASLVGAKRPRNHFEQRGLAGAVGAHERYLLPTVHGEVEAVIDALVAEMLRHALEPYHHVARTRRLDEVEMNGLLLLRHLDELDFLKLLHAVLNLFRLRGLIAEFLDERLHMGDFFLLLLCLLAQTHDILLALAKISRVVALIEL